jgi:hypothetical protein
METMARVTETKINVQPGAEVKSRRRAQARLKLAEPLLARRGGDHVLTRGTSAHSSTRVECGTWIEFNETGGEVRESLRDVVLS